MSTTARTIDFTKFLSTDEFRPDLHQPGRDTAGRLFYTDGRKCVWDLAAVELEPADTPLAVSVSYLFLKLRAVSVVWHAGLTFPTIGAPQRVNCRECKGTGKESVYIPGCCPSCGHEIDQLDGHWKQTIYPCTECDGTGGTEIPGTARIAALDMLMAGDVAEILRPVWDDLEFADVPNGMIGFRLKGAFEGLSMGCRK